MKNRNTFRSVFLCMVGIALVLVCFTPWAFAQEGAGAVAEPEELEFELEEVDSRRVPSSLYQHSEMEIYHHPAKPKVEEDTIRDYYISTGGTFAFLDRDFREFLDYGASVTLGMRQRLKEKLSLHLSLGLTMLNGEWSTKDRRERTYFDEDIWFPGYVAEPGQTITEDDLPPENLGIGYHGPGSYIVFAENLRRLDVDTTLFLLPVTFGIHYWVRDEGKIKPYVGGDLGFVVARRECVSRALKETYYFGPQFRYDFNDYQRVTGQLLSVYGGVEIPLREKLKIVAQGFATLYDLKKFDPILEIFADTPPPEWNYKTSPVTTFSYQEPVAFGVFKHEYVTGFSIGVVMPF
ncbi:MAG: hypothetical protein RRA35_06230 [Desulfomonilia bacterium]|nr:hypothetical protein [Desulfomonilia bacterium]